MRPHNMYEEALCEWGYMPVCGVDEAGRGPWAGPVVAGAVILPRGLLIDGVNDSKKLTPRRRRQLAVIIKENAVAYGVGLVDAPTIDRINILQATFLAMKQAVSSLAVQPGAVLTDGPRGPLYPEGIHSVCLVRGDTLSISIAAASILAKVTRDAIMEEMDELYPQYGFRAHKGYGTAMHTEALRRYGPCPQHRLSFKVRALM